MNTSNKLTTMSLASVLILAPTLAVGATAPQSAAQSLAHTVESTRAISVSSTVTDVVSDNTFGLSIDDNDPDGFEVTAVSTNGALAISGYDSSDTYHSVPYTLACTGVSEVSGKAVTKSDILSTLLTGSGGVVVSHTSPESPVTGGSSTCTVSTAVAEATERFSGDYSDTITFTMATPDVGGGEA